MARDGHLPSFYDPWQCTQIFIAETLGLFPINVSMYNIEVCGDGENHRMLDSLDHQKAHNWRIILARLCYVQSTSFFLWRSHLLANVHQPPRTPRGKRNVFGAFVANLKGYHLFMFKNFKSVVCYWIRVPQVCLCLNVWNFAFCLICA